MKDLTIGRPMKIILLFAIPILIGNLFNLAYNLVDTRIIGTYLGNDSLAAVGSISTLSDLLVGFVVGIANGFAVIIAMYFGRGDKCSVKKLFVNAIEMCIGVSALIIAFSLAFLPKLMDWINIMDEHREESASYITVIIIGLLFCGIYNVLAASLRAVGDAYTPLIFLVVSAVLNVFFDIICVKYLKLGVRGAAVATLIAQFISAVSCFIYTWVKYPMLRFGVKDMGLDRILCSQMLKSGFSMGMMSCLVAFGTLSLQTAINTLGTNTIVAHAATRKLTNIYMLPFGVLGTAMATYCGQNYGAGRKDRIRMGLRDVLLMSYVWCLVTIIISYTICPHLIKAITDTNIQEVISTACCYQRVDTLFYLLVPTICIVRNSLQGMGDHVTPVVSSGMELVLKMVVAFIFTPIFGYWAIIFSEPVSWSVMVIPLIISMVKKLKKY